MTMTKEEIRAAIGRGLDFAAVDSDRDQWTSELEQEIGRQSLGNNLAVSVDGTRHGLLQLTRAEFSAWRGSPSWRIYDPAANIAASVRGWLRRSGGDPKTALQLVRSARAVGHPDPFDEPRP